MQKRALITGFTGQDGSYLAEFLLAKGYEVYCLVRRVSTPNYTNIGHLLDKVKILDGDMTDSNSLMYAVKDSKPDEVYNLAAQSYVALSWKQDKVTEEINSIGVKRILSAVKNFAPRAKFYQASTSEIFGNSNTNGMQNENTAFTPRSPYGISKMHAFWTTRNYRESYNIFACNGILFNHESERRGLEFVSRKITDAVGKMHHKLDNVLRIGNIQTKRDWGHAKDYVEAMWMIMQQDKPEDFVIATGETRTCKEFLDKAFNIAGISYDIVDLSHMKVDESQYSNSEKDLENLDAAQKEMACKVDEQVQLLKADKTKNYVVIDPQFFRPAELYELKGDATKARTLLGWKPTITFDELVERMVKNDIERLRKK